tara:strand:+ start:12077 stop:12790 length:714 start_codon:yes stop_codon:yes gene_type:complete
MLKFNGRPDGLGNRIEELINLECYCIQNDISCNYYWNNKYNFRSYNNLLNCKNILIQDTHLNDCENIKLNFGNYNNHQMINAAKNIKYFQDINIDISYISIHIRSTDKLNNRGKDEFTYAFFIDKLKKTLNYLNNMSDEMNIFIASDDDKYKNYLINNLNKNYHIVDPFLNIIDDTVYKDYFSLVHSKKILMVPKFSSFAASASLLSNNILVSHCHEDETSLYRYRCNVEYIYNIKT